VVAEKEEVISARIRDNEDSSNIMGAFHFDFNASACLPDELRGFLFGYVAQGPELERRGLFSIRNSGDTRSDLPRMRYYGQWWANPDGAQEDLRRWMAGTRGAEEPPCEGVRELTRGRSPDDAAILVADMMRLPMREQDGAWVVDRVRTAELVEAGAAHEREVGEEMVARARAARQQWLYERGIDDDHCIDETPACEEVYATFPSY
jgi:hypothetical protein